MGVADDDLGDTCAAIFILTWSRGGAREGSTLGTRGCGGGVPLLLWQVEDTPPCCLLVTIDPVGR